MVGGDAIISAVLGHVPVGLDLWHCLASGVAGLALVLPGRTVGPVGRGWTGQASGLTHTNENQSRDSGVAEEAGYKINLQKISMQLTNRKKKLRRCKTLLT